MPVDGETIVGMWRWKRDGNHWAATNGTTELEVCDSELMVSICGFDGTAMIPREVIDALFKARSPTH